MTSINPSSLVGEFLPRNLQFVMRSVHCVCIHAHTNTFRISEIEVTGKSFSVPLKAIKMGQPVLGIIFRQAHHVLDDVKR